MLTIGLVVNPCAGVGGPAAMKGSDGAEAQARASELGVMPKALERARQTFLRLSELVGPDLPNRCRLITLGGAMGQNALEDLIVQDAHFAVEVLSRPSIASPTSALTTRQAVVAMLEKIDLLVFVGGDGTARDVLDALQDAQARVPVLGIPAGVKMHSGVFATSPDSAARLLALLLDGGLVAAHLAEIRDIDEAALRRGVVGSQRYGEVLVPSAGGYLQHVKSGGKEVEALVLLEIAAEIAESVRADLPLVLGPGSTCFAVKQQLLEDSDAKSGATLLGVDVVLDGKLLLRDASSVDLLKLQDEWPDLAVVVSFSRGQGFVLGRGNQQLSPEFLTGLEAAALQIVSSRTKLGSLAGRPLLVDSGSAVLDRKFSGLHSIISGYDDRLLYLVQPA